MPVRFVLGRAGTGKTHHCFEMAWAECQQRGLDTKVLFILPPQGTFMAERRLSCRAGRSLAGVQVVSFDSLVRELAGQDTRLTVTPQGRRLVLSHLLRQHADQLQYFGKSATQAHLAARLDAALAEIEAAGLAVDDLEAVLGQEPQTASPVPLSGKLHDLKLLAEKWQAFLGQDRIDPAQRLREAAQRIAQNPAVKDCLVLVDGFAAFSQVQRQMLLALVQGGCRQMDICLLVDADSPVIAGGARALDELSLLHRGERAFLRLREWFEQQGVPIAAPLLLRQVHRAKTDDLRRIEQGWDKPLTSPVPAPPPDPGRQSSIALIEAPTAEAEVRAAARQIRQWQGQDLQGLRLRDIGVLARNLRDYRPWLSSVFAEYGIPCFVDQRRTMAHHALLRLVRDVLQIAHLGWQQELVLDLLKCGLLPLSGDQADLLENFARRHGIERGKWVAAEPWDFSSRYQKEDQDPSGQSAASPQAECRQCERLRRQALGPIAEFVKKLQDPQTDVRRAVSLLAELLTGPELAVRQRLSQWIVQAANSGNAELAAEHQQAWTTLMELLEEMVHLLGTERMAAEEFAQTLDAALEGDGFSLAITPPTVDQVLVGQVDRSRSPDFVAVIVMGMNDGLMPCAMTEDAIFSDAERILLTRSGIDLEPPSSRLAMDEELLAYIALTRPSQYLTLTRHTSDDAGRPTIPSPYLGRLERLVGLRTSALETGPLAACTIPEAALAVAQARKSGDGPAAEALRQWLHTQRPQDVAVKAALAAAAYRNDAKLAQTTARRLLQSPLRASVSQIECFACCPFKHFSRYSLNLQPREQALVSHLDLGNVYHHVLEELVHGLIDQKLKWSDPKLDELIPALAQEAAATLRGQLMLSSQRNQYLLGHIQRTLQRVIDDQRRLEAAGSFHPVGAEVAFGLGGSVIPPLAIDTPAGHRVLLRGKIDRVDIAQRGHLAAVYDYKLSGKSLRLDHVYHGLALQLLTYLLVVQQHGRQIAGSELSPAGAFYLQLQRKLKSVPEAPAEFDPGKVEARPRGVFDADCFGAFDQRTTGGASDVVAHYISRESGALGNRDRTDGAAADEFAGLLQHVQQCIAAMADRILDGQIMALPYLIGTATPCPSCDYRSVCRFEPSDGYRELQPCSRTQVLSQLRRGPEGPAEGGDHAQ